MKPLALLLLAALGYARVPDSVVEQYDTAVRARYEDGSDGFLVRTKLAFKKVDSATVTQLAPNTLVGLVQFMDETGGTRHVEVLVKTYHGAWRVDRYELLDAEQLDAWSPERHRPAAAGGPGGDRRGERGGPAPVEEDEFLRDATVEDIDGNQARVTKCAAARCVLMFVDPWHPGAVELAALRGELQARGYPLRFVVTTDQMSMKQARARKLGAQALIDRDNRFRVGGGIVLPVVLIIDDLGNIHKRMTHFVLNDVRAAVKTLLAPLPSETAPKARATAKTPG